MVKLYLRKVKEGKITIDDVPLLWREKVRMEMEKCKKYYKWDC